MSYYKCGHNRGIVILDSNPMCFAAYLEWKDTKGFDGDKSQCWECWCKTASEFSKKNLTQIGMTLKRSSPEVTASSGDE